MVLISEEMLSGCKQSDKLFQEKVYEIFYSPLIGIAIRYVGNFYDASDIINRAMFIAFTKIETFKGDATNFYGWVKRILINESIRFLKLSKRYDSKHVEDLDSVPKVSDSEFESNEFQSYLMTLLASLNPIPKAVFNLYIIEGYLHKEIADLLNISEANSKWHLHSARKLIQKSLKKEELI